MTSPLWNFGAKHRELIIQSTWSASDFCGKSPSLIISFHKALWTRCSSAITAYVISRNDVSPQKPETIILHFHVLSAVSGRNRSIVSVIVNVLIVILNSATLLELIGPLIHPCSWPRLRKSPFMHFGQTVYSGRLGFQNQQYLVGLPQGYCEISVHFAQESFPRSPHR